MNRATLATTMYLLLAVLFVTVIVVELRRARTASDLRRSIHPPAFNE